jgi:hypothetical protein
MRKAPSQGRVVLVEHFSWPHWGHTAPNLGDQVTPSPPRFELDVRSVMFAPKSLHLIIALPF